MGATVGGSGAQRLLLTKDGQAASFLVNLVNDGEDGEHCSSSTTEPPPAARRSKVDTRVQLDAGEVKILQDPPRPAN
jgi:hypothetical protein